MRNDNWNNPAILRKADVMSARRANHGAIKLRKAGFNSHALEAVSLRESAMRSARSR
jgi:hypothetical protein